MATQKISAAQAAQVYAEVPGVLRKLASERDSLREKLAATETELVNYRTRDRIEKIARRMEERNINVGISRDERITSIKEAHAKGRSLEAIEEAVEMTAPNGEFAKVAGETLGNGADALETYLIGDLSQ